MTIEKNGKVYVVNECKNHWTLTWKVGTSVLRFEVDKEICGTFDSLKSHVLTEEIF